MNLVDIIVIVFVFIWVVRGFFYGFALTLTTFAGILGGIACAIYFSKPLADMMGGMIKDDRMRVIIAYVLIFLVVSIAFRVLGLLMRELVKKLKLRSADAVLGAVVSGIEALLITMIALLLIVQSPWEKARASVAQSVTAPYILEGARVIVFNMPDDMRERLEKFLAKPPESNDNRLNSPSKPPSPSPSKKEDGHKFV